MKQKRQTESLHNLHIRISKKDYQKIAEICDKLDITLADYFNEIIHADGYEKLQMLARRICKEPRSCKIEMDSNTQKTIDDLSASLNSQTTQLRRIGTNLSNLMSKIARQNTELDNPLLSCTVRNMRNDLETALEDIHKVSSRLVDILYDDEAITKIEYIGHDIWDE